MKTYSIWEFLYEKKKITKPIRLIEFFAGIGAQYKALKRVFDNVESYKTCEWAYNSILSYNAMHIQDHTDYSAKKTKEELIEKIRGISTNYNEPLSDKQLAKKSEEWVRTAYNNIVATHDLVNIMNVHGKDLEIKDTDTYEYIMTYSFPCQDLSLAGNKKGMSVSQAEGGTRSGLLWEVERILDELENKPQILLMENVPEVIGKNNIQDFVKWEMKLERLGYQNYIEILNAKDYEIPQNRRRCFMVSILGEYAYAFPEKKKLYLKLKDLLENQVDEKYYLSKKKISEIASWGGYEDPLKDIDKEKEVIGTLTTHCGKDSNSMKLINDSLQIKNANSKGFLEASEGDGIDISTRMQYHRGTVQKDKAQTITCKGGENVGVVVKESENLKQTLCNDLIESGAVEENDIIKHSFTGQIMSGKKKAVEKQGEMITLTTRGDCFGVVVKEDQFTDLEKSLFTEDENIRRYIDSDKIDEFKEGQMATTTYPNGYGHGPRTHNESIALNTIDRPVVKNNLRIRKLTPLECMRLMGFEDQDYNAMREIGMSDMAIYHMAGDSIVVNVLEAIFKEMK